MNLADWASLEGFIVYAASQIVEADAETVVLDRGETLAINGDARKLRSKPAVVFVQAIDEDYAAHLETSAKELRAEGRQGDEDEEFDELLEDLETRAAAVRANLAKDGPYEVVKVFAADGSGTPSSSTTASSAGQRLRFALAAAVFAAETS